MRRLSEHKKEKIELDIHTNASRVDSKIENNETTMLTLEDKLFLRNLADKESRDSLSFAEEVLAFEGTTDSLKNKLYAIWNKSIEFICKSETKYKKKILESLIHIDISYIESNDPRNEKLALSIPKSIIKKSKDIIAKEYVLTLRCIYRIKHIYETLYKGSTATSNPFTDEFKISLFIDENFGSGKFINLIVQEFITLSIHANELGRVCELKLGVPLSKEVRDIRSTEAWKTQKSEKALTALKTIKSQIGLKAEVIDAIEDLEDIFEPYGEEVLKDRVREVISKLNPQTNCKSIKSIVDDNEKLFIDILIEYKEGLGSPIEKDGKRLTFEKHLDKPGLIYLIKKWNLFREIKAQIKKSLNTKK